MASRPKRPTAATPPPAAQKAMQAAVQAHRAGDLEKAIGLYRRAVKAAPGIAPWHYNLGIALKAAGQNQGAVLALTAAVRAEPGYIRAHAALAGLFDAGGETAAALRHWLAAFRSEPEHTGVLAGLVGCLGGLRFTAADAALEALAARLLQRDDVEGQRLAGAALSLLELKPEIADALAGGGVEGVAGSAPPALLLAVLERTIVAEPRWEAMLTRLRAHLSADFASLDAPEARLVQALAAQMLATDYAFAASDEELNACPAVPADAALQPAHVRYALYRPLAGGCDALSGPGDWAGFLALHLNRPDQERKAAEAIPSLTAIEDGTSKAVRDQYAALPYPRWKATRAIMARPRRAVMAGALAAAPADLPDDRSPLRVLVAGCGTGKHAVDVATRFADAEVLAIDLSRPSLGYAKAQAERLGIRNVRFAEADILALGGLEEQFDHIEAMGVLHHLAEPLAGWRVLRGLLAADGTMRIGLYSRRGRTAIQAAQAIAKDFGTDPSGLRALRQAVLDLPEDHPAAPVRRELDFYTLSGVRDALAHEQEHDYTLPDIQTMLAAVGMRFLGFEIAVGIGAALYREAYPDDEAMADLTCWDALEQANPSLFHHMYQFWCAA